MSVKKRGLGRGLDALLTTKPVSDQQNGANLSSAQQSELQKLPIEWLKPGKYQPRKDMSQDALNKKMSSIGYHYDEMSNQFKANH